MEGGDDGQLQRGDSAATPGLFITSIHLTSPPRHFFSLLSVNTYRAVSTPAPNAAASCAHKSTCRHARCYVASLRFEPRSVGVVSRFCTLLYSLESLSSSIRRSDTVVLPRIKLVSIPSISDTISIPDIGCY